MVVVDAEAAPGRRWLGVLGQTGFTAWVGINRIGELLPVTPCSSRLWRVPGVGGRQLRQAARAGRVLGSAGGPAKVAQVVEQFGYDDAMDYRAESPLDAVPRLAPDGIDLYFDNVGGPHLVAALHNMKIGGHVALCGMISQYSADGRGQDINHLIEAVLRARRFEDSSSAITEDMRPEFEDTVAGWLRSGDVEGVQTVTDGIDHAVEAFLGMLRGGNVGKALVRLDTRLDDLGVLVSITPAIHPSSGAGQAGD